MAQELKSQLLLELLEEGALVEAAGQAVGGRHLFEAPHRVRVAQRDGELVRKHGERRAHRAAPRVGPAGGGPVKLAGWSLGAQTMEAFRPDI